MRHSLPFMSLALLGMPLMADEVVTIDQVPAPVKAAIIATISDGTLATIEMDNENGTVTYEIKYTLAGQRCEVTFTADGKLAPEEADDKDGEHEDGDNDGEHEDGDDKGEHEDGDKDDEQEDGDSDDDHEDGDDDSDDNEQNDGDVDEHTVDPSAT